MECWIASFGDPTIEGRNYLEEGLIQHQSVRSVGIQKGDRLLLYYTGSNPANPQEFVGYGEVTGIDTPDGKVHYTFSAFDPPIFSLEFEDFLPRDVHDRLFTKARLVQNRFITIGGSIFARIIALR